MTDPQTTAWLDQEDPHLARVIRQHRWAVQYGGSGDGDDEPCFGCTSACSSSATWSSSSSGWALPLGGWLPVRAGVPAASRHVAGLNGGHPPRWR